MKTIFESVKDNLLFQGIAFHDFETMLRCMESRVRNYEKEDTILLAGDSVESVGILVCGAAHILKEDREGRQSILTELGPGDLFGETFACSGIAHSPVSVVAQGKCAVLFINYKKIITACSSACAFHSKLIENMLFLLAKKNLLLNQKIEILSKRSIRERLLLCFDLHRNGKKQFTLPYNREALAAYLCVDRSALSAEISKMRQEGLLRCHKNEFELLL